MSFLLAILPRDRDISPVYDCLRKFEIQFQVKSNFEELTPFAESYASGKEINAEVKEEVDSSPVVDGHAVPAEAGQINDCFPNRELDGHTFNAHDYLSNEVVMKEEAEDMEIKSDLRSHNGYDGMNDESDENHLPLGGLDLNDGTDQRNERNLGDVRDDSAEGKLSCKQRKSDRVVQPKKFFGDVIDKREHLPKRTRSGRLATKPKKLYDEFVDFKRECPERKNKCRQEKRKSSGPIQMDLLGGGAAEDEEDNNYLNNYSSEKTCPVDGCTEKLASPEDLVLHMKSHPFPLYCRVCKRSWPSGFKLRAHFATHTGSKPFKCGFCKMRYAEADSLKQHQRTHTGEHPYECASCGYKTYNRFSLTTHKWTHTRVKPYFCTTCPFRTAQMSELLRHKKMYCH